jgi:hypothetical protein
MALESKDKVQWRAGDTPSTSHLRTGVVKDVLPGGLCLVSTKVDGVVVVEEIRMARLKPAEPPAAAPRKQVGKPAAKKGRKKAKKAEKKAEVAEEPAGAKKTPAKKPRKSKRSKKKAV